MVILFFNGANDGRFRNYSGDSLRLNIFAKMKKAERTLVFVAFRQKSQWIWFILFFKATGPSTKSWRMFNIEMIGYPTVNG
jgi:hypothetical protein